MQGGSVAYPTPVSFLPLFTYLFTDSLLLTSHNLFLPPFRSLYYYFLPFLSLLLYFVLLKVSLSSPRNFLYSLAFLSLLSSF